MRLPPPSWRPDPFAAALLVLAALVGACLVHVRVLNEDEGWILLAARAVLEGRRPFQDFAFTQGPLLPWFYAPGQALAPGLEAGRWTSLALSLGSLGLVMATARRLSGPAAGRLAGLALAGTAYAVGFAVVVKGYAPTGLLLSAAGYAVATRRPRHAAVLLALAGGTRLSAVAAIPALLATERDRVRLGALAAGVLAVVYAPYLWPEPGAAWHDLVAFHVLRDGAQEWMGIIAGKAQSGVACLRVFLLPLALVVVGRGFPRFFVLSTVFLALAHLVPARPDVEYHLLELPALAVAGAVAFHARRAGLAPPVGRRLDLVLGMVGGLGLLLGSGAVPVRSEALSEVEEVAGIVRDAGGSCLTLHAVVADRVPEGLEMGIFAFQPGLDARDAQRFHTVGPDNVLARLDEARSAVLTDSDFTLDERGAPWPGREVLREEVLHGMEGAFIHVLHREGWGQFGEGVDVWVRSETAP